MRSALTWAMEEDDRPLSISRCIVCVTFVGPNRNKTWRLAHVLRGSNTDRWIPFEVCDAVNSNHADFDKPPTNAEVYRFLKEAWWKFGQDDLFILLKAGVCSNTWREMTGEPPTQFYSGTQMLLYGMGPLETLPHEPTDISAPKVLSENNRYRMWYDGQGNDRHHRILYAESADGLRWKRDGVALDNATAASVVKVGDRYYMYFTLAEPAEHEQIELATSRDGIKWTRGGVVISHGSPEQWDHEAVATPVVLHEKGMFEMWYDGYKNPSSHGLIEHVARPSAFAGSFNSHPDCVIRANASSG